ncbi:GntR family transcriptional regulator [Modestobacter sp. DSM 44400]|uniref:GntR family transcriptional regulator n=1 Tax=Modestobacter sp. DSM 44400 TaxID=1550230 RepID=UPI001C3161F5|nr:GntR family transcriptional regulator [Modestobacter sp. DSM 44400]
MHADVRARLDAGDFTGPFPGEFDLAEQYEVSRHTIREALRQLRAEGAITSGRGRRARVATADPVITQSTGVLYSLFSSVEASGLAQVSVVRALDIRADGVVAVRLGLEESSPLLYLERLRLAGDEPLALDRAWIPAAIGEGLLGADFRRTSLYDELLALTGIPVTGGQETVRAVIPSKAECQTLGLTPPSAACAVERTATSSGVPIEWRHTLIRADRFWLTNSLDGRPTPGPGTPSASALTLAPSIQ